MGTFKLYQNQGALDYTPEGAVTAGTAVSTGSLVGIATRDIAAGVMGAITTEGIFSGAKTADAHAFVQGEIVYLVVSTQIFTHDDNGGLNPRAGKAAYAATAAATTLYVDLNA